MSEYKIDVENLNDDDFLRELEEVNEDGSGKKSKKEKKPTLFGEIMSWVLPFVIAIVVVWVLKSYVIINANVPSGSMENTIMTGDNLIGLRMSYSFSDPKRGDIIIFPAPDKPEEKYIKRIIGLPGETVTILNCEVYINGERLEEDYLKDEWRNNPAFYEEDVPVDYVVPEDSYFVMGDNRNSSEDARYWTNTWVTRDSIIGKASFIYWPLKHFKGL